MSQSYLEEAVDGLVADSRLGQTLTDEIVEVLLKALLVLQEAHGDIIVRVTVVQLGKECPAMKRIAFRVLV